MVLGVCVIEVMKLVYDNFIGGYLGVVKIIEKIWERFYWVFYKEDVVKYIRCCIICEVWKNLLRVVRGKFG